MWPALQGSASLTSSASSAEGTAHAASTGPTRSGSWTSVAASFSQSLYVERLIPGELAFFSQSGRLDLSDVDVDQRQLFEGNSVLRGQQPVVPKQ